MVIIQWLNKESSRIERLQTTDKNWYSVATDNDLEGDEQTDRLFASEF